MKRKLAIAAALTTLLCVIVAGAIGFKIYQDNQPLPDIAIAETDRPPFLNKYAYTYSIGNAKYLKYFDGTSTSDVGISLDTFAFLSKLTNKGDLAFSTIEFPTRTSIFSTAPFIVFKAYKYNPENKKTEVKPYNLKQSTQETGDSPIALTSNNQELYLETTDLPDTQNVQKAVFAIYLRDGEKDTKLMEQSFEVNKGLKLGLTSYLLVSPDNQTVIFSTKSSCSADSKDCITNNEFNQINIYKFNNDRTRLELQKNLDLKFIHALWRDNSNLIVRLEDGIYTLDLNTYDLIKISALSEYQPWYLAHNRVTDILAFSNKNDDTLYLYDMRKDRITKSVSGYGVIDWLDKSQLLLTKLNKQGETYKAQGVYSFNINETETKELTTIESPRFSTINFN